MNGWLAAAAQYPVTRPASWEQVEAQLSAWVVEAARHGAKLLVFPEYASLSLSALFAEDVQSSLSRQLVALQTLRDAYLALHQRLADAHGVHVLAGSFPWQVDGGRYVNRAWLLTPAASAQFQDKQVMTRFEREQWQISRGEAQKIFRTELGCLGVSICYDAEFPLLARQQVEMGAEILLVPSCTDAMAGYQRVRVAAQARALEGQCYVIQSPLVGEAPWSPAVDVNVGAAAVYGPPDHGFPPDGVVTLGTLNEPGWIYGEIHLAQVQAVRKTGQVLNYAHWPESM